MDNIKSAAFAFHQEDTDYNWKEQRPAYLNLEALHVVIAHPLVSFVGIWHILDRVPHLSPSFQEVTDLEDNERKWSIHT